MPTMEGPLLMANEGWVTTGWEKHHVVMSLDDGSLAVYREDPNKRSSAAEAESESAPKADLYLPANMWTMHDTSADDDTSFVIVDRAYWSAAQSGDRARRSQAFQPLHLLAAHGNEKARWMRAASQVESLSPTNLPAKAIVGYLPSLTGSAAESRPRDGRTAAPGLGTSIRVPQAKASAQQQHRVSMVKGGATEYRVKPNDRYPHQWMTARELREEMLRPSAELHDLREREDQTTAPHKHPPIGSLQVEVLSCTSLPDEAGYVYTTKANARTYLVCGTQAFETDAVPACRSPVFPARARRGCTFPVRHAFARLFAGVFSDASGGDGGGGGTANDAFVGRVVVDLAALRPDVTYDVTLPLRASKVVYYGHSRMLGFIRLRLVMRWTDGGRGAVLSYLHAPSVLQTEVNSIPCADARAFRNLVLTLNGKDLPGQYSGHAFNATMREVDLYKVHLTIWAKELIQDIITWKNPRLSWYLLLGWMFCVNFSSVAMVFPYAVGFIVLLLLENYNTFVLSNDAHFGFKPLTIQEIVSAVLKGQNASSSVFEPLDVQKLPVTSSKGRLNRMNHLEFPCSNREEYPKATVKDATAEVSLAEDESLNTGQMSGHPNARRQRTVLVKDDGLDSDDEGDASKRVASESISEQDEDIQVVGLSMKDQLRDLEKVSKRTALNLFGEQLFCARSDLIVPKEDRTWMDLDYNFLRELGMHRASSNPVAVMKQDYLGPMQLSFQGMLKIFRASFNAFAWKDSILSCYLLLLLILVMLVLVVFPWRPFLAVVGAYLLGPQNWAFIKMDTSGCVFHFVCASSMYSSSEGSAQSATEKNEMSSSSRPKLAKGDRLVSASDSQLPAFMSYNGEARAKLDPKYHKVVVPYTAFNYRRFYDWPPDPLVSSAKSDGTGARGLKTAVESPIELVLESKAEERDGLSKRKVAIMT